jgi:hypothetical protein
MMTLSILSKTIGLCSGLALAATLNAWLPAKEVVPNAFGGLNAVLEVHPPSAALSFEKKSATQHRPGD